ncbi:hypothetical protein E2C01_048685 [Portunus trituberculatus]|uniref:Uncharacterized protein n=1 Tax=Portunus trituberculatus TaxID=210409 RepID=A0A5B7G3R1_PORTR|nr:hypothetical protein [Portunus trituberculatus]
MDQNCLTATAPAYRPATSRVTQDMNHRSASLKVLLHRFRHIEQRFFPFYLVSATIVSVCRMQRGGEASQGKQKI